MFEVGNRVEFKEGRFFNFGGASTQIFIGTPALITRIEEERIHIEFHDGIIVFLTREEAEKQLRLKNHPINSGDFSNNPKLDNDWSVHVGGVSDFFMQHRWDECKTMNFKQAAGYVASAIKSEFAQTGKLPKVEIYWQNWWILEFRPYNQKFYWQDWDFRSSQGYYILRAMQNAVSECMALSRQS